MRNPSVFIDTNIWFSAFYKEGTCSDLLRELNKKQWKMVISELVLEEIIRNIKKKIPNVLSLITEYINTAKPIVVKNPTVEVLEKFVGLSKRHDLPILTAAIKYHCRYFVTGNIKDFQISRIEIKTGLEIITPKKLLQLLV